MIQFGTRNAYQYMMIDEHRDSDVRMEDTEHQSAPPYEFETSSGNSLSEAVVSAVATARDVDPLDLEVPLHDVVDPDALDQIFRPAHEGSRRREGRVAFTYGGFLVTVISDGRIVISDD